MDLPAKDRIIALGLIVVGVLAFTSNALGKGTTWFWVMVVSALFFAAYRQKRHPFALIPGGVVGGYGLSLLLNALFPWSHFLPLGLAGGFAIINGLEPRRHAWALWPAMLLGLFWACVALSYNLPLILTIVVLLGGFFWLRSRME